MKLHNMTERKIKRPKKPKPRKLLLSRGTIYSNITTGSKILLGFLVHNSFANAPTLNVAGNMNHQLLAEAEQLEAEVEGVVETVSLETVLVGVVSMGVILVVVIIILFDQFEKTRKRRLRLQRTAPEMVHAWYVRQPWLDSKDNPGSTDHTSLQQSPDKTVSHKFANSQITSNHHFKNISNAMPIKQKTCNISQSQNHSPLTKFSSKSTNSSTNSSDFSSSTVVDSINSSDNKLYSDSKHNNGIMAHYNQVSVPARLNFPNGQLSNRSTTPLFRRLEKPTPNLIDLLEDSSQNEETANDF